MPAFAILLGSAEQMVSSLSNNQSTVSQRGVTAEFIDKGQALVESAKALNLEQEQLKSALKLKTEQFDAVQKKLKDWQAEATSSVKLAYRNEKGKWSEFGIKASK